MVITTSNNINDAGVLVFHSINEFIEYSKKHVDEEIFVVGGANIFEQLVPYADRLYKTEIEHDFDGDTYMPTINYDNFKLINTIPGKVDDKNIYDFNFKVFQKNKIKFAGVYFETFYKIFYSIHNFFCSFNIILFY